MNNIARVNPKFFKTSDFPFKLLFLKIMSFLFALLENLTIARSLCFTLLHTSRSPAEAGVPVKDNA